MINYKYNLKALIELLEKNQELDNFIADIFHFNLLCDENYGIEEVLFDPHLKPESKLEYMAKILQSQLTKNFYNFLTQLVKNNDINFYSLISRKFINLLSKEKNCNFVEITSALPLSAEQQEKIKAKLVKQTGQEVYIYNTVSSKIIGGFLVNFGEKMVDLSVQGSFDKLKNSLVRA